ncbi:von Willebrand domain-containing protein [Rhypophila decipiens]|uniref:von Willebrand domain-containing protein n=1 Tax=Rhypophila decipiens TaxID=261697 RepID=A0AAN7B3T0_9PEZI|nr:von Willebrand domain-containing protein [Rhypophila decipiens]
MSYNDYYGREWICGLYFLDRPNHQKYLPRTSLSVHSQIIGTTSRSVLTQKFVNPQDKPIPELRYTFPLYDGVSVVGFVCTINNDRVIRGTVKERAEARQRFKEAVARGQTAGLLDQLPDASDVFTTTIGNIPAGAEIKVELTYLGELKHDAESDGIRFTIPTRIAPRYGGHYREVLTANTATAQSVIEIVVDAEMPKGSNIKAIQSPSHPISVTIGNTSLSADADMSLQKASATLSLGTAELDKDFVLHLMASNSSNPVAVLETHPTIPNQRALMATLVPKFNLPPARPEIIFVCDRSGSMGNQISNLKAALRIFLKSLPLGVKFNICSFGSQHEFLFKNGSMSYDAASLEQAERYVSTFAANFGGTEMYQPIEAAFKKRYKDMNLEVFLLTDGEIWDQDRLFKLINTHVSESNGDIRLFTLGIGNGVSHALVEGVARAGNGFAQTIGENEKMNAKVLRMLKASLSPHVKDYSLEIKYGKDDQGSTLDDDDFELVEKVMDSLSIEVADGPQKPAAPVEKPSISLFDPSADADVDMVDASLDQSAGGKYSHVPPVSEPKILQAPFDIPPLYPFNRTSVYLLLSAQSPQKEIKSVVLRGTSAHGPLELEIPVTVLPEKGETIHQLAARKAVKELEEGRGWIYHAEDVKEPGKLLKDKFEGRFSDMVEREAVRLGVEFQVGGRWCSFVAVEDESGKTKEARDVPVGSEGDLSWGEPQGQARAPPGALSARFSTPGPSTSAFGQSSATISSGLFASAATPTSVFGQSSVTSGGLFGNSSSASAGPQSYSNSFGGSALCFSSPPPPQPMMPASMGGGARFGLQQDAYTPTATSMAATPALFGGQQQAQPRRRLAQSSAFAYSKHPPGKAAAAPKSVGFRPVDTRDTFDKLVSLQSFAGSWTWNDEVLGLLEVKDADARLVALMQSQGLGPGDLLATALVLAFFEKKLGNRKDEWELLADKARDWLSDQMARGSGGDVDELVEKLEGLF